MKKKVSFSSFPLLKGIKNEKEVDRFIDRSTMVYQVLETAPKKQFIELINSKDFRETFKLFFSQPLEIDYHTKSYEKAVMDSNSCILDTIISNCKKNSMSRFNKFLNLFLSEEKAEENYVEILESVINLLGRKNRAGILIGKHEVGNKQLRDYFIYCLGLHEGEPRLDLIRVDEIIDNFDNNKSYEMIDYVFNTSNMFYNKKTETVGSSDSNIHAMIDSTLVINDACWVLELLVFKEIAETEVEYIDVVDTNKIPKNISKFQRQNCINNLDGDITINYYSANWYTEIIRNEEFGVRGHWRNQPYKDGYKLIFIKPFKKHGYHRKAEKDQVEFKQEKEKRA